MPSAEVSQSHTEQGCFPDAGRLDLSNLVPGDERRGIACLVTKESRTTRHGAPYYMVAVRNRTGEIGSKVWSDRLGLVENVPIGAAALITGVIKDGYDGGSPELEIRSFEVLPDGHPVCREVNLVCPQPLSELHDRFKELCRSLSGPYQAFLRAVLEEVGWSRFREAPAALPGNHHGYLGGYLQHSLEVAELAIVIAGTLPGYDIDRDMLVTGALLHDVGKVVEYDWNGPIRLSRKGHLGYHTASGQVLIALAARSARDRLEAEGFTQHHVDSVLHIVESHHGRKEYGSPKEPACLEALIVHLADEISAKLSQMADAIATGADEGDGLVRGQQWPFRHRYLLRHHHPDAAAADASGIEGKEC